LCRGAILANRSKWFPGLAADDSVVVNPPDSLIDGAAVHIAPPPKPASQARGERKTS